MSDTVDIGAARVRLIVDAADFQPVIDQGKNAIIGFGNVAQQAYDRTEKGTRRAADALLDYVNSLGRADTTMDRYIRNASRMGVEKPVLDAAITAWGKYSDQVEQAAAAQTDVDEARKKAQAGLRELMSTQAQAEAQARALANAQAATRAQNLGDARAAQSQQDINALVAPGLAISTDTSAHRLAAEEAFAEVVARENAALAEQEQLALTIATARQQASQATAQQNWNKLLGIPEQEEALALIQRRHDATLAFLPALEEEARLEQENSQLASKQQAFIQQLENTATTAGKTYYEMLQLRAAELGLGEAYTPLITKIKAQNEAMGAGTPSAKQYEFALRGLPAQFTDIVVSLQGGQRPLTVLLQQGGQIKDMFGGVGNAVKVVGQQVLKLATNPWLLLAGVVAGLAAAAYEAQSRMTDLAIAVANGNQVAGDAQGLSTLSESLAKLDHTSIGNADAAVGSLAAAGKLTGTNLAEAAQATARWATITGQGVDEIAGKFNQLASDPMAAVLDGTLRVTAAQYAQLAALDRVGDKVGEVSLAVKLYQAQVNDNSDSVRRELSDSENGWIDLKVAITGATHALSEWLTKAAGNTFNLLSKPGVSITGIDEQGSPIFAADEAPAGAAGAPDAVTLARQAALAQTTKLTLDQANANKENQKTLDEYGTKQQKFTTQLALLNAQLGRSNAEFLKQQGIIKSNAGVLSGPGYDKAVNGLRLKIFGENQGGDPTRPVKEWEKTNLDAIKAVQQAQEYLYQAGTTGTETYYAASKGLVQADEAIQLQSIAAQEAALKGRLNSEAQIHQLQQQELTVRQTTATAIAKLDHDELVAVQAKTNAYHDYVQSLADANIALSRQGDQTAAGVGTGSREAALANAKSNAQAAADLRNRAIQDAVDALPPGDHSAAQIEANRKIAASDAALSTQLTILQGNYDALGRAEGDFIGGSIKAWQDWKTQVSNFALEGGKVFSIVMDDISQDISDAATKGHLSFKNLLTDLLKEITEFGAKQALLLAATGLGIAPGSGKADGTGGAGYVGTLGSLAGLVGAAGGTGTAATGLSGLLDLFSGSFGGGFFAKGDVFAPGSGLSAYRNSIISQPTHFPFAKGGVPNIGLMGEKGSEGIFPLTRTSGGELGVKAVGNNQQPQAVVNQTFIVPGAVNRQSQDQLARKQAAAVRRATSRG